MYRERLDAYRAELGRRGGKDDVGAWKKWIAPHIGHLPIGSITRDDVERVRDALDQAILLHSRSNSAEGISAKRARNVWVVVTTTFRAACMAKRRDLRVRTDNPCTDVLPPERGESRRRPFVYPNEVVALLSCEDVPREWRELYALACYLYLRPGELRALTWGDIDLDAGIVHISKAWDERSGDLKGPKTRNGVRDVPIHPNLRPLLERLSKDRRSSDLVAPIMRDGYEDARAKRTREHLARAGVTRPRLTENTATTMMVGFRSWRDTGITWLALAGVDVAKIQRRAGHDDVTTTMGYVKAAEDMSGTIGEPFPPLPPALVGVLPKQWAKSVVRVEGAAERRENFAERAGFETNRTRPRETSGGDHADRAFTQEIPTSPASTAITPIANNSPDNSPVLVVQESTAEPKREGAAIDPDDALRVAIKAAVDAGDFTRAEALLGVLKAAPRPAPIVTLVPRVKGS